MAQRKLDSFFRPKVPRLEEKVEDDGISGGDGNEEDNVANKDQGAVPLKKDRGFSLQNNLKNCQRNRLQAKRLDTLMVISAEGPPLQEFPFKRALIKWRGDKSRRIFSTSVVDHE